MYCWGIPTFYRCLWNGDPAASDGASRLRAVPRGHGRFGFAPWDNQITAMNAMVVMFDIVCPMADRLRHT